MDYFLGAGFHLPRLSCSCFFVRESSCGPEVRAASKTSIASLRLRRFTARSARRMILHQGKSMPDPKR